MAEEFRHVHPRSAARCRGDTGTGRPRRDSRSRAAAVDAHAHGGQRLLTVANAAMFLVGVGIGVVLLPIQVELVDPADKVANPGLVSGVSANFATVFSPLAGHFSDRSGPPKPLDPRRRPRGPRRAKPCTGSQRKAVCVPRDRGPRKSRGIRLASTRPPPPQASGPGVTHRTAPNSAGDRSHPFEPRLRAQPTAAPNHLGSRLSRSC